MAINKYMDPRKSLILFELKKKLDYFIKLYNSNKFPQVLMLSGEKGSGKFTMINHFLTYLFDKDNYNLENCLINDQSLFYKQYTSDLFPNIVYLSGNNFKRASINSIRNLKTEILHSTILNKDRFIIFDDIELFNKNIFNALLKIIEEPSPNNHFILINNKTKPIIETIHSRSVEIKLILDKRTKVEIIKSLIKLFDLDSHINFNLFNLTPGNFLIYNSICQENKININDDYISNLTTLLNLYKKSKNINFFNMILFLTDFYFLKQKESHKEYFEEIIESKSFIVSNLNNFITYNLNQISLINAINSKIDNE